MAIKLLKAKEVATILGVSKGLVYSMIRKCELPCIRFRGGVRVRQEDLEQFIALKSSNQQKP